MGRKLGLWASVLAPRIGGVRELDRVALLRARLLRRLGWPTAVDMLRRASDRVMRTAMLGGRPAWQELEIEVQGLLEAAQERYPVLFEK